MKEHLTIANSPLMFVLCSIVILFVVVQAVLFMRRAWKHGTEIGLDKGIMKSTVTGSALFSIVPSIPILIILVMLMSVLGNYFPWLRLSVIGSSSYENVAANIAARSFGLLSYTDEGYTSSIFVATMWAMSICILYEPLLVIFGRKPLDKGMTKLRKSKPVVYNLLIDGIFIAMMSWFCAPYLTYWTEKPAKTSGTRCPFPAGCWSVWQAPMLPICSCNHLLCIRRSIFLWKRTPIKVNTAHLSPI